MSDEGFFVTAFHSDGTEALDIREVDADSPEPIQVTVGDVCVRLTVEQLHDVVMACDDYLHPVEDDDYTDLPSVPVTPFSAPLAGLDFEPSYTDPGRVKALREAREILGDGPYYTPGAAETLAQVANWLLGEEV